MSYFEKVREKLSGEMEIFCLEQVDSTNTFLKKRAGDHNMLALALRPTAGWGGFGARKGRISMPASIILCAR